MSVTLAVSPGELSVSEAQTIVDAGQPCQGRRTGGGDRRAAGSEGLQALHRDQRADRDHRRDDHPDVRVRDDRLDAAADPQRDPRACSPRWRSSASSAMSTTVPKRGADAGHDDRAGRGGSTTRCSSSRAIFGDSATGSTYDESIARSDRDLRRGGVLRRRDRHDRAPSPWQWPAIPLVTTMGLMAGIAVVVAVLAALTLLPAALAITGPRINSLRVPPQPPSRSAPGGRDSAGDVGEMGERHRQATRRSRVWRRSRSSCR